MTTVAAGLLLTIALGSPPGITPAIAKAVDDAHAAATPRAAIELLSPQLATAKTPELVTALRLVRATFIERDRGPAEALTDLRGLKPPPLLATPLADRRLRLAQAAGETRVALPILQARHRHAPNKRARRLGALAIADLALAGDDPRLAARCHAALGADGPADLRALVEAHRARLDNRPAGVMKHVVKAIESANEASALARVDRLVVEATLTKRLLERLGRAASLTYAEALSRAGRASRAIELLSRFGDADDVLQASLRVRLEMRDYAGALAIAEQILARPTSTGHMTAALERARMLGRLGRAPEAERAYADFAATYKDDPAAEQATFMAAWILHEGGQAREAARRFGQYLRSRPRSELAGHARWLWAFNLYRAGEVAAALPALDKVIRRSRDGERTIVAQYFRARALERLGRIGEARAVLMKLVTGRLRSVDKAPYYRAIARSALRQLDRSEVGHASDPSCGVVATVAGASGAAEIHATAPSASPRQPRHQPLRDAVTTLLPHLPVAAAEAVAALASAGLDEATARVLGALNRPGDDVGSRAYLEALAAAGDATRTLRAARRLYRRPLQEPYTEERRWMWRLAYPDPPRLPAVEPERVERSLLLAIGRQESHFMFDVVSQVGALGVMQLMPETGARLGQIYDTAVPDASALLVPTRNVPLAVGYIDMLRRNFREALPLVAAAYNAGPPRVMSWLELYHDLPLDAFVESIPFRETRGYVKKVLSAYTAYRLLEGDPEPERWARQRCLPAVPRRTVDF